MTWETLWNWLTPTFTTTTVFNIEWVLNIIATVVTTILITRDKNAWAILLLPVTIMWHIIGLTPSFIWYIITSLLLIVKIFSTDIIGNMTSTAKSLWKGTGTAKRKTEQKQREKEYEQSILKIFKKENLKRRGKDINQISDEELLRAILKGRGNR